MEVVMLKISEIPKNERPRERLFHGGSDHLSNQELIALLVGSGTKTESALMIAARILGQSEQGLRFLSSASIEALMMISGVGETKASRLIAAIELGKRMSISHAEERIKLGSPEDIASLFMEEMRYLKQEVFKILLINARGEYIGKELITIGGLTHSLVEARDVYRAAIRRSAFAIALVHNHPSGNPSPSERDVDVTKEVIKSGEVLGIQVMDHIVIGDGKFVSMRRKKLI